MPNAVLTPARYSTWSSVIATLIKSVVESAGFTVFIVYIGYTLKTEYLVQSANWNFFWSFLQVVVPDFKIVVFTVLFDQPISHTVHNKPGNCFSANPVFHV